VALASSWQHVDKTGAVDSTVEIQRDVRIKAEEINVRPAQ